jgi:hypothetical protein
LHPVVVVVVVMRVHRLQLDDMVTMTISS